MRFAAALLFVLGSVGLAVAPASSEARADDAPAVGEAAPDFTLPDAAGEDVTLSSFRGASHVLVVFYPRDFSPG